MAAPQRVQRAKHTLIAAILDDLDPGVVRGDVDLVERVEAHPAVEVARSDQVDLYHVAGHARGGRGVRDPLRSAPAGALPPRGAGALQDRLDRALGRHGRAELLKLPRNRGRADLRPRILLQPRADLQHDRLDPRVGATCHPLGRARATLRPTQIERVIARRPLRDPPPRATEIPGDRPRRLARQPATRRLPTKLHLQPLHRHSSRSINTSARASKHPRMERCACGSTPRAGNDVPAVSGERCSCGRQLTIPSFTFPAPAERRGPGRADRH